VNLKDGGSTPRQTPLPARRNSLQLSRTGGVGGNTTLLLPALRLTLLARWPGTCGGSGCLGVIRISPRLPAAAFRCTVPRGAHLAHLPRHPIRLPPRHLHPRYLAHGAHTAVNWTATARHIRLTGRERPASAKHPTYLLPSGRAAHTTHTRYYRAAQQRNRHGAAEGGRSSRWATAGALQPPSRRRLPPPAAFITLTPSRADPHHYRARCRTIHTFTHTHTPTACYLL